MATSGADYGYDGAGRLANYEGALPGLNSTFPAYMPKYSNYTFNVNGNVTARPGQSLVWDVQNRLAQVTGGTTETYLYDPDGQRVKKTVGSTVSLYPFAHYEITGSTVTKYYFFAGMRVAMKQGSTLTYLHSDHLGSTVLETNTSGNGTADQKYRAYGKQRDTGAVVTDHKFTGQKLDGTGLQYYNARYYDPAIGTFISPDAIIPDPTNVFDYNRYMYVRGRVMNLNDPTGHCGVGGATGVSIAMFSAESCGGGGGGALLIAGLLAAVALTDANLAEQERFPVIEARRTEVHGVPLTEPQADQSSQPGWLSSFEVLPQQTVTSDISANELLVESRINQQGNRGSNDVYRPGGQNAKPPKNSETKRMPFKDPRQNEPPPKVDLGNPEDVLQNLDPNKVGWGPYLFLKLLELAGEVTGGQ